MALRRSSSRTPNKSPKGKQPMLETIEHEEHGYVEIELAQEKSTHVL